MQGDPCGSRPSQGWEGHSWTQVLWGNPAGLLDFPKCRHSGQWPMGNYLAGFLGPPHSLGPREHCQFGEGRPIGTLV